MRKVLERKMAIIRRNEFRAMNQVQLDNKLVELQKELIRINSQIAAGTPPQNPGKVREIKKTIARINTKLNSIKPTKEVIPKK